jgi:2-oxoglutarate ferredoxin oxidoreductase subunit alpha
MARCENVDIVIAMNPDSFEKDLASLHPGGVFFYADHIKSPVTREDVTVYSMPVQKLSREANTTPNLKDYIANMVYVGVLAQMLGIDLEKIRQALDFHLKGKQKAVEVNFSVVEAGSKWAADNLVKKDPYTIEPMDATQGCIMADGNTAAALGALYGGVQFAGWYPITPASSLAEAIMEYAPQLRKDPETGKTTVVIVQAEDELAAIGMTVGAGWGGLRAMTSTSGPGLSLMAEYAGLAYFTEVPIVVWDIQRVGPATGLPTRTAQADLTFVNFLAHGDTQFVMLLPGSVYECFEFGWKAFDLAEQLQTPVFVMSDLDFGMNNWMTKPFDYPDRPMQRGKVLWESDLERLNGQWSRYVDQDNDGIPYRTLPGNRHPRSAYFTRGTGHDENARYTEDPVVWERVLNRLRKKYETARSLVPGPVIDKMDGARFGIISFGSCDPAVTEARDNLERQGIRSDYLRLKALPFTREVSEFIHSHPYSYVVELNRDGQMRQLLSLEVPDCASSLISVAHLDGLPISAEWVESAIRANEFPTKEV